MIWKAKHFTGDNSIKTSLVGSANGNRTRGLAVQSSSVRSKWLCFQCGWYSGMLRNTATNRRRHSAVTARSVGEGLGGAARFGNLSLLNLRPNEPRLGETTQADSGGWSVRIRGPPRTKLAASARPEISAGDLIKFRTETKTWPLKPP